MKITIKYLVEVLERLDKCENMAQICWIYDNMPIELKHMIEETRDKIR